MTRRHEDTCSDIALLQRIAARDADALAELYDRQSRLIFGVIRRVLKDRAEAEELLQDVFVLVWTRAGTYSPSLGTPAGWLVGIARNRAIDRLRANHARLRAVEAAEPPDEATSPEAAAALGERQWAVAKALDALPGDQRDLIEQAYFLGLSQSELAERCGLPLGTVKTRMRAGMTTLRQQLQDMQIAQ